MLVASPVCSSSGRPRRRRARSPTRRSRRPRTDDSSTDRLGRRHRHRHAGPRQCRRRCRASARVTAKIWASSQLSGFASQTFGYGYVTVRGTAQGRDRASTHLLAWVGFANGNTSNVCAEDQRREVPNERGSRRRPRRRQVLPAVAYVPPHCGIAQRKGYTVPERGRLRALGQGRHRQQEGRGELPHDHRAVRGSISGTHEGPQHRSARSTALRPATRLVGQGLFGRLS